MTRPFYPFATSVDQTTNERIEALEKQNQSKRDIIQAGIESLEKKLKIK